MKNLILVLTLAIFGASSLWAENPEGRKTEEMRQSYDDQPKPMACYEFDFHYDFNPKTGMLKFTLTQNHLDELLVKGRTFFELKNCIAIEPTGYYESSAFASRGEKSEQDFLKCSPVAEPVEKTYPADRLMKRGEIFTFDVPLNQTTAWQFLRRFYSGQLEKDYDKFEADGKPFNFNAKNGFFVMRPAKIVWLEKDPFAPRFPDRNLTHWDDQPWDKIIVITKEFFDKYEEKKEVYEPLPEKDYHFHKFLLTRPLLDQDLLSYDLREYKRIYFDKLPIASKTFRSDYSFDPVSGNLIATLENSSDKTIRIHGRTLVEFSLCATGLLSSKGVVGDTLYNINKPQVFDRKNRHLRVDPVYPAAKDLKPGEKIELKLPLNQLLFWSDLKTVWSKADTVELHLPVTVWMDIDGYPHPIGASSSPDTKQLKIDKKLYEKWCVPAAAKKP